jgi:hypothetical protein
MKIFILDQKHHYQKHLSLLKSLNIVPYHKESLKHKISQVIFKINSNNISKLSFDFLFNYNIFPSHILSSYSQWIDENRSMQVGDTILQQIYFPPFIYLSQKIIVGVRIKEVFNSDSCKGFSYETLEGHVEKGVSTFKIEVKKDALLFSIETFSAPNGVFLALFLPLSSMYQDYCTKEAIKNIEKENFKPFCA